MTYIPHTEQDTREMLAYLGVSSIEELFREIPEHLLLKDELNIPSQLDEQALFKHFHQLASKNQDSIKLDWFLGAGIYDRYIPATVSAVLSRGEFLTAYTPYQPELSQGYLQTIYEFQTMIANLYEMDVANASMYDGATATAEAALMAAGITNRKKVLVSHTVHPCYRAVLKTYCSVASLEYVEISTEEGVTSDLSSLDPDTSCLILQYPNFFGILEDLSQAREITQNHGALLVVCADPIAMGLLKPPGAYGADIVVGEGQQLGIPMGFGGPLLGLFTCKQKDIRRIPGRIVGRTKDRSGHMGYTMTLRTREQDIRREKATSNICTNQALMALAATIYLTALGKNGLQSVARSTVQNTQYAIQQFAQQGLRLRFNKNVFGEFVLELPIHARLAQEKLLEKGIMAGLPLGDFYPKLENCLLIAVTELRTRAQIDHYVQKMKEFLA
jgi:glycine dehydrogenase subunit 1